MAKAETIERKWYIIDAANKPLGRTAVKAAEILRGKHRPEFTPHVDCGEFVIIINASKAVLTGNKLEDKYYHHHSGYIGGLKSIQYKKLMATRPEMAMELAVKGMLPHNKLGAKSFTRLKVYAGAEHKHEAQKPVEL
jgi:large subunit ribosomal protein L13